MKATPKKAAGFRKPNVAKKSILPVASSESGCAIVGVGASAGGLEAFTRLLKRLPTTTGLGFVLVQHLDPQHESALTQILSRATSMPVCEATNDLRVEADKVYIIPPNTTLRIADGILKLQPRVESRTPSRSIDIFFEALALDQGARAIGVILSGSATDGTLGLEAIKAEGGITFAQDDSAAYDSMPRSAVGAGYVDFVLSPEGIADEMTRIAKHPYVAGRSSMVSNLAGGEKETSIRGDESPLPARGGGRSAGKTPPKQETILTSGPNREMGFEQTNTKVFCCICAITPASTSPFTNLPPSTGASPAAWC